MADRDGADVASSPCPFHDLPPGQTVWIDLDGVRLPLSAEKACDDWHLAEVLRPKVEEARHRMAQRLGEILAGPPPWARRPNE